MINMLDRQTVVKYLRSLSQDEIAGLLLAANVIPHGDGAEQTTSARIPCPHCGSHNIILYGFKCGKQRYFCKSCGKTYVPTTRTVLSMSHFGMDVWQDFLRQTLEGDSLSYAEKTLGLTHQTAFNMRHKLLMALEDFFGESPVVLGDVTEFDETFVLDSYKGKPVPETAGRPSRRHGAKAADCKVEDVNGQKSGFYNLNTVNNLHSFIKGRYTFYRGVATKYLNRYNALFQIAYRSIESKIALLIEKLFRPGCTMNIHTVKDITTHNLLVV